MCRITCTELCACVFYVPLPSPHLPCLRRNMGDVRRPDNRWGESRWILSSSVSQSIGMETLHMIWHNLDCSRSLFLHIVKTSWQRKSTATECYGKTKPSLVLGRKFINWNGPQWSLPSLSLPPLLSQQMAEQLMTLAYENGINLFDTAEVYAAGKWVYIVPKITEQWEAKPNITKLLTCDWL